MVRVITRCTLWTCDRPMYIFTQPFPYHRVTFTTSYDQNLSQQLNKCRDVSIVSIRSRAELFVAFFHVSRFERAAKDRATTSERFQLYRFPMFFRS